MSFDTDKKDQYERILWYHPESDCYGEVFSRAEFESFCNQEPIDDVTNIDHHEKEFKERIKNGN